MHARQASLAETGISEDTLPVQIEKAQRTPQLIVVFYWLPVTVVRNHAGLWEIKYVEEHPLLALRKLPDWSRTIFVGCIEPPVPVEDRAYVERVLKEDFDCHPLWLPPDLITDYYHKFCWNVLWPLFHYQVNTDADLRFDRSVWDKYCAANMKFAQAVRGLYRDGDAVMVNDYHFFLLPTFLRHKNPGVRIAYFFHTPWPSSEIYRTLPWRTEILRGMLNCDFVQFQVFDYTRHFLVCCNRLLGLETTPTGVEYYGRTVKVLSSHIGITPQVIRLHSGSDAATSTDSQWRQSLNGRKLFLGIDNLDALAGIALKMLAFEQFLASNAAMHGKVALIQVAIPRPQFDRSAALSKEILHHVARINSTYGGGENLCTGPLQTALKHPGPVYYIESTITTDEQLGLMRLADCLLITSCREGFNLMPFHFIVANEGAGGVVVSEFAGCSRALSGAVRVNPWNYEEVAAAMQAVLDMDKNEKRRRAAKDLAYINSHSAHHWATKFSAELKECKFDDSGLFMFGIGLDLKIGSLREDFLRLDVGRLCNAVASAPRRLLIVNPDSLFESNPAAVAAMFVRLASNPKNLVYLLSEHDRHTVDGWFAAHADHRVHLTAEHGYLYRDNSGWHASVEITPLALSWMQEVQTILQTYTDRTDGAYVEKKETGLTWHYEHTDAEFGQYQAKDLYGHLEVTLGGSHQADILHKNKRLEVKSARTGKGVFVEHLLYKEMSQQPLDFLFACGDDTSDESVFTVLKTVRANQPNAKIVTCALSNSPSQAKYFVPDAAALVRLFEQLADVE